MATPVSAPRSATNNAADGQIVQAATNASAAAVPASASGNNQDTVTLLTAAQQATALAATPAPAPPPSYLQVLYLTERGLTTNQIAAQLGITAQAAETYLGPSATPAPTTNTTA